MSMSSNKACFPGTEDLHDPVVMRDAAMLHWMQELAPHGIFTTDNEMRIQTWNHWLVTHSRMAPETVIGRLLFEVFPELPKRNFEGFYRQALEGQVNVLSTALHGHMLRLPVSIPDSSFEEMQQTVRIGPLVYNRVICGTITTIEDVTQREMQARAMREHTTVLEEKVRERTSRLNETIAQLESFSYTVSHDLRAPIRVFTGYTDVLLEDFGDQLPRPARGYVERMQQAAEGMESLTRDLLQFSRVSRQQISVQAIEVGELIQEIARRTPALQEPGVLEVQAPLLSVLANRSMLQQCLSNLLDNALKFVAPGRPSRIRVRSEFRPGPSLQNPSEKAPLPFISPETNDSTVSQAASANRRGHVRIFVEDNGIGIAPEHHRQIFGIFERIHNARGYDGTGIGLAIVARAMQRMNGSCGVESSVGSGSSFWLELPLSS